MSRVASSARSAARPNVYAVVNTYQARTSSGAYRLARAHASLLRLTDPAPPANRPDSLLVHVSLHSFPCPLPFLYQLRRPPALRAHAPAL